jgi:hypothetical protein
MLPIEFLLLYPISLPVAFLMHKAWKKLNASKELPEAQPYQFERDKPIAGFNQTMQHVHRESKKMYRGKLLG